ncbi:chemotaxis protein CheW [Desulfobacterales bacterium HSG16]|nr:chemotaxis protein CheW [Desulfobacterales bacterium HSG16]
MSFLFSARQVEDILRWAAVFPVPFSPPHIDGIINWQDRIMPVLSLEKGLELDVSDTDGIEHMIMIRSSKEVMNNASDITGAVVRAKAPIRILPMPIKCWPVSFPEWLNRNRKALLMGFYEWEEGYLAVVHMDKMLQYVNDIP